MCVQEVCGRLTKGPSVQLSCPAVPQWLCSPLRQERRGCPQGRQDSGRDDEAVKLPPQPRQTEGHLGIFGGPSLVCLAGGSSGHAILPAGKWGRLSSKGVLMLKKKGPTHPDTRRPQTQNHSPFLKPIKTTC